MKIIDLRGFEILTTKGTSSVRVKLTVEEDNTHYSYTGSAAHGTSKSLYEVANICSLEPSEEAQKIPWFTTYQARINQAVLDIKKELIGKEVTATQIDNILCDIDGTEDKSRLGSSIMLAISIAAHRAEANSRQMTISALLSEKIVGEHGSLSVPHPLINIINGGMHALSDSIAIQEFLLCPSFNQELPQNFHFLVFAAQEVFAELQQILKRKNMFFGYGAEGGITAQWNSVEQVFDTILLALERRNLTKYFSLGIDCAASTWYNQKTGTYQLTQNGKKYTADQLIEWYKKLLHSYPISVVEDPFAEDDLVAWKTCKPFIPFLVGDDITATHINRLRDDSSELFSAVVVKPDQIGTVSETIEFIKKAKEKKLELVFSRRSAETDDPFIADMSISAGQASCKFGNISQGAITKYNHLLFTVSDIMYEMAERGEFTPDDKE